MKDSDFDKLIELTWIGGGFIPANPNAIDLSQQTKDGETLTFREVTARDLSFHKCYMSLLGYIWTLLPKKFKETIPKDKFYVFVKHLRGNYDIVFTFRNGTKLIEYKSIAFGAMSQKTFEEYIKELLPWIYSDVINAFYKGTKYDNIIAQIEKEYEKFLSKL